MNIYLIKTLVYDGWPTDHAQIGVEHVGIAARDTESGVILGSFNPG